MAESASEAVSDDTEATSTEDESSDASTQTEEQKEEKRSLRQLIREDPAYNAEFQRELSRAISRRERAATREAARSATAAGDKDAAATVAARVAQEQDDDDDEGDHGWSPEKLAKLERVRPQLELLMDLDEQNQAHDEWYIRVYERVGKADIDRRLNEDPQAFARWLRNETDKERLKSLAPSLAGAIKADEDNARLRRAPAPLTGGAGGGGSLTLSRYESMSPQERRDFAKKNPQAINDMVARLG